MWKWLGLAGIAGIALIAAGSSSQGSSSAAVGTNSDVTLPDGASRTVKVNGSAGNKVVVYTDQNLSEIKITGNTPFPAGVDGGTLTRAGLEAGKHVKYLQFRGNPGRIEIWSEQPQTLTIKHGLL